MAYTGTRLPSAKHIRGRNMALILGRCEGRTLADLGREVDLSRERVRQILECEFDGGPAVRRFYRLLKVVRDG